MASDRQIAANRSNAQLSRGPRTLKGKSVSRTNAHKHGLSKPITEDGEGQLRIAAIHRVLLRDADASESAVDLHAFAVYYADMMRIRGMKAAAFHHSNNDIAAAVQAAIKMDRYANAAVSKFRAALRASKPVVPTSDRDRYVSRQYLQNEPNLMFDPMSFSAERTHLEICTGRPPNQKFHGRI